MAGDLPAAESASIAPLADDQNAQFGAPTSARAKGERLIQNGGYGSRR